MKKNGFTLVELLAVIVILAIIALIAVPVFLGIINNSKKSSDKESVNLYTDTVEKAIQKKQMSDPNFMPDKCTIKTDGNLECFSGTTSLGTVKVSMKGTKPTSGTILIDDEDITYQNIVLNGKTYYETITNLVTDASPTGLSVGDKYTYKVNNIDTFNFYVLSIEGDKVNLIMDRNICNDGTVEYTNTKNYCKIAWHEGMSNNTYGPDTAIKILYTATKDWKNVENIIINYNDENNSWSTEYGYTSIVTSNGITTITGKPATNITTIGTSSAPLKSRLPQQKELRDVGCPGANCPSWILENTTYLNELNEEQSFGYWLLSSGTGDASNAMYISNSGSVDSATSSFTGYGIRPVITVSSSDLQ